MYYRNKKCLSTSYFTKHDKIILIYYVITRFKELELQYFDQ